MGASGRQAAGVYRVPLRGSTTSAPPSQSCGSCRKEDRSRAAGCRGVLDQQPAAVRHHRCPCSDGVAIGQRSAIRLELDLDDAPIGRSRFTREGYDPFRAVVRCNRAGAHSRAACRRRGSGRSDLRPPVSQPSPRCEEYARLASDQDFRTDVEAEGVVDLVLGPLLMRLMARARPPSSEFTGEVVNLVVRALRDQPGAR
jgi:hypothetical protein